METKDQLRFMQYVNKDENGCLASAGYTWSKLNKECVRAFTGIQLNPTNNEATEDVTLCTYVLFNETGDKAEVFLPDEKSFILTRASEGRPWVFNEFQLIPWKGYVLKKADKGGRLLILKPIFKTERFCFFRSDLSKHAVTEIKQGSRIVLTFGIAI